MSKPIKELVRKQLITRFEGLDSLAVVDLTGVDATTANEVRARLRAKDIRVMVVKNSLARQAFAQVGLAAAGDLLDGPSAIAWGGDSVVDVVRELLAISKDAAANLKVKAAMLEGQPYGPDRIEELSKYPTREEAVGKVVGAVLFGAGGKLVAALLGPGARLAGALKAMADKADEPAEAAQAASA